MSIEYDQLLTISYGNVLIEFCMCVFIAGQELFLLFGEFDPTSNKDYLILYRFDVIHSVYNYLTQHDLF